MQRTDSLKYRIAAHCGNASSPVPEPTTMAYQQYSSQPEMAPNSPKMMATAFRNVGSNVPTPKGSPMRRPNLSAQNSPKRQLTTTGEEQWIDGPRLSKSKVAEARHLLKEINHVKHREQWIDGPKMVSPAKTLVAGALPGASTGTGTPGYGFMDSHKKTMIRQWVENQSSQVFQATAGSPQHTVPSGRQLRTNGQDEDVHSSVGSHRSINEMVHPLTGGVMSVQAPGLRSSESSIRSGLQKQTQQDHLEQRSERSTESHRQNDSQEEEDQDSGPSEVPPALPLIQPMGSRDISHDSLHRMCSRHESRESLGMMSMQHVSTKDCGFQVTEDDITKAMG